MLTRALIDERDDSGPETVGSMPCGSAKGRAKRHMAGKKVISGQCYGGIISPVGPGGSF
jgi:hypothetical protein